MGVDADEFQQAHSVRLERPLVVGIGLAWRVLRVGAMAVRGSRVLVVEDSPDVRELFVTLLQMDGAEAVGAANGTEALNAFRSQRFDVVMTDLGLPDMPADTLIRAMLAEARGAVDVVVITGEGEPAVTRALQAGASVIFTKPCRWGDVYRYLDGHDSPAVAA
jgi:CheY-like chemotaxis protein